MVTWTLKERVQRLQDVREIKNLMGRYVFLHEVNRDSEFPDTMYAQKTPGTSYEVINEGVYLGLDSIRRALSPIPGTEPGPAKGDLSTHPLSTPVIEVAGDGKTAKGVWMSLGYENCGLDPETLKPMGGHAYNKYGCDFVKEDGQWKLWHLHVYRVFKTPWNVPYTDEWEKNIGDKQPKPVDPKRKPDLPTTVYNPYALDTERELVPAPPDPYETWSETFSYGPPEK